MDGGDRDLNRAGGEPWLHSEICTDRTKVRTAALFLSSIGGGSYVYFVQCGGSLGFLGLTPRAQDPLFTD
jgi:hypothetical protein